MKLFFPFQNRKSFTLVETLITILFGAMIVIMFAQSYGTAFRTYADLELQDAIESEFSKSFEFLLNDRTLLIDSSTVSMNIGTPYSFKMSPTLSTLLPLSSGNLMTANDCKNNLSYRVDPDDTKYKICSQIVIKQKGADKYCVIVNTVATNSRNLSISKQERIYLNKKVKLSGTVGQSSLQMVSGIIGFCD